ncbi:hypothetical protein [Microbispora siamensis]|uniref:hypothetical protein n=1 Tax=Microbispora siamensis TaxID=564413 RepID=UPI0019505649|nr:hypothetical protein [Microbispora siamensis]
MAILVGLTDVVVAPQALAAPSFQDGRVANSDPGHGAEAAHGAETAAHGAEAVPGGGKGKKGKAKKGKKGKEKKGKEKKGKGHGHGGARIDARLAGFGGGLGGGFGDDGGGTQHTAGINTANAPTISSPPFQLNTGKRNVNAPAGNSAVDFAGTQQVSSVSVFTDSLSGNCTNGIKNCSINQTLEAEESRGSGRGH